MKPIRGHDSSWQLANTVKLSEGVTAVDMVNNELGDSLLAVGTETGSIDVYGISLLENKVEARMLLTANPPYVLLVIARFRSDEAVSQHVTCWTCKSLGMEEAEGIALAGKL